MKTGAFTLNGARHAGNSPSFALLLWGYIEFYHHQILDLVKFNSRFSLIPLTKGIFRSSVVWSQ